MTINDTTLALAARVRASVNRQVNSVTRDLTAAWVQAWDEVRAEWRGALEDLAASGENGRWPTQGQVVRAERAQKLLELTQKRLMELGQQSAAAISASLPQLTAEAAAWEARLIGSQVPPEMGATATSGVAFNRVDPAQLEAIVARTTQQVTVYLWPLSVEATAAMQAELIRGVAVGDNPRRAAARMLKRVEGRFNGGLARATNVARTEMLDANRYAARAQDLANTDVLTEWEWYAKLDKRTCPSCLSQHGSRHPLDEIGPIDHQQGRCDRVPVTKTWRELGFDIDEPPSATVDAQKWFDDQPGEDQVAIMGEERLALLRSGDASWDDLSTRRTNAGWRDSMVPTPVSQLRRDA